MLRGYVERGTYKLVRTQRRWSTVLLETWTYKELDREREKEKEKVGHSNKVVGENTRLDYSCDGSIHDSWGLTPKVYFT